MAEQFLQVRLEWQIVMKPQSLLINVVFKPGEYDPLTLGETAASSLSSDNTVDPILGSHCSSLGLSQAVDSHLPCLPCFQGAISMVAREVSAVIEDPSMM